MHSTQVLFSLCALAASTLAAPTALEPRACTGTISSLGDVAAAVKCANVVINGFTVPAGSTLSLSLVDGATVTMNGDVAFGKKNWDGPLFQVSGKNINFNGNGHTFDGNGAFYWDGQGGNGGVTKPNPMMKIKMSGTFTNVKVLNSPARVYSIGSNPAALTLSKLTVDNSAGDAANSQSDGKSAGHNTDGFDVSGTDITIKDSTVLNQDDCLAINDGSNIVFTGNTCSGGHGISIGSISSDKAVSKVTISNNVIKKSDNALRIKTKASAASASVSDVTYTGNTATDIRRYGVIVDQSYPSTLGTPGTGVTISAVTFSGKNTIAVGSSAQRVAVNCGSGACKGTWDWSGLTASGGSAGKINYSGIKGISNQ